MRIQDKIYGTYTIEKPVILKLIQSKPVQRLKKISQFGLPDKYYHIKGFSRFEHSIGVMILLKNLGASLEEQVAGLLHDISHYAFSHVADWVFGHQQNEDLQDSIHASAFRNGEVYQILKKYGFKPTKNSPIRKLSNFRSEITKFMR